MRFILYMADIHPRLVLATGWPLFCSTPSEVKLSALRAIPTTSPTRLVCFFNHLRMAGFLH